ncbi:hypothetical protein IJT93_10390 [bacterium]|nr:hypothetical protein [bacterium]
MTITTEKIEAQTSLSAIVAYSLEETIKAAIKSRMWLDEETGKRWEEMMLRLSDCWIACEVYSKWRSLHDSQTRPPAARQFISQFIVSETQIDAPLLREAMAAGDEVTLRTLSKLLAILPQHPDKTDVILRRCISCIARREEPVY